jgi:hypothetical protein
MRSDLCLYSPSNSALSPVARKFGRIRRFTDGIMPILFGSGKMNPEGPAPEDLREPGDYLLI